MTGRAALRCIEMVLRQRETVCTPRGVEVVPDDIRGVLSDSALLREIEISGIDGNVSRSAQIRHMAVDLWWDIVNRAEGYQ